MHAVFVFNKQTMQPGETIGSFAARLQEKAAYCEFGDAKDKRILERVIMNIKDEGLIQKAMEKKWTLDRFLEEAGRRGDLREEVRDMREEFKVARIQDSRTHHRGRGRSRGNFRCYQERPIPNPHRDSQQDCVYCGKSHPFGRRDLCTASGKRCSKCGRWNHFASVCKSGQTHTKETPPQGYSERKSSNQRSQSSRGNHGEYRNQDGEDEAEVMLIKQLKHREKAATPTTLTSSARSQSTSVEWTIATTRWRKQSNYASTKTSKLTARLTVAQLPTS